MQLASGHWRDRAPDLPAPQEADVAPVGTGKTPTARLRSRLVSICGVVAPVRPVVGSAGRRRRATALGAPRGLVETAWDPALELTAGEDWTSGAYVSVLHPDHGAPGHVPFTVRPPARSGQLSGPAPILFVSAAATWQAYNRWGGASLYDDNSSGLDMPVGTSRATAVSFDRPHLPDQGTGLAYGWKIQFVRWQERQSRERGSPSDPTRGHRRTTGARIGARENRGWPPDATGARGRLPIRTFADFPPGGDRSSLLVRPEVEPPSFLGLKHPGWAHRGCGIAGVGAGLRRRRFASRRSARSLRGQGPGTGGARVHLRLRRVSGTAPRLSSVQLPMRSHPSGRSTAGRCRCPRG
jgi:hypothetical protein